MAGTAAGLTRNRLLRPDFTEQLAEKLGKGACIKLVSPHGQGRRRTLADLRRCLPGDICVLQANLRDYPQSLTAMLADLASQAVLSGANALETMLGQLQQRSGHTLIILHNLDELHPGPDSGYDDVFFRTLNTIATRPGIALLCVCEHEQADWPLNMEAIFLPPLTPDQVLEEIARRNPPIEPDTWPAMARMIAKQPCPYTLLERPETWPKPDRAVISP